ncbi:hypothetical protein EVAR_21004_1 [Eumeta japonica]|uniref:Uncharacterized protein n=1 Tax=Eumeta variegata TaxID=151549 RepID=A0A4C1V4Z2_EUMVA|nr:hypothetical protein EVAR_21004_1 [Eumeta japonica]
MEQSSAAGRLLAVVACTAGCLLAIDAWTTSSRLSLGRCWVGAVMEQSRLAESELTVVRLLGSWLSASCRRVYCWVPASYRRVDYEQSS